MIEYQHIDDKSSVCYALGHPTRPNITSLKENEEP